MKTQQPVATEAWDYADTANPKTVGKKAALNLFLNRRTKIGKSYQDGPVSDLYFPLFDKTPNPSLPPNSATLQQRKLVGALTCYVYWQVYFNNILSNGTSEVVAVLQNSCGQQYTYSVVGDTAEYIGQGDLHDSRFDHLQVTTGFGAFLGSTPNPNELLDGQCTYRVRVYPTQVSH
jgi:hypothetical protein